MTRRVVVLGSTGSIGRQAVEVVQANPERFRVVALAAGRDIDGLERQCDELGVRRVAVADAEAADRLRARRSDLQVSSGDQAVAELATFDADVVLNGITGAVGLASTLAALSVATPVALANKESLVVGGDLVTEAAEAAGGREQLLVPVDSEHSALAQCLRAGRRREVARLVLTASGGPFRGRTLDQLRTVTADEALAHPTWRMGPMVTVNSATMMNKGLELIEAHLLFALPWRMLDVVVHPQSIVHSMVEFVDGSTIAQLSPPDMRLPIQLALAWPDRLDTAMVRCDWTRVTQLNFEPVDAATFRALDLARVAGERGGGHPAVLNAANEVAVESFLAGAITLPAIVEVVESVLDAWDGEPNGAPRDFDEVLAVDGWARARARRHCGAAEFPGRGGGR